MSYALNIDLHTHSNCSDGSLSPAALIERAAAAGVQVLALTDHDTVAGLDEAQRAAERARLTLVPGVEISAAWRSQAIHVLGLWIDPASPELRGVLHAQGELRRDAHAQDLRASRKTAGFQARNCWPPWRAIPDCRRVLTSQRPWWPAGMSKRTMRHSANTWARARRRILPRSGPRSRTVVGWIRAAGGVASLAHPARYALSAGARAASARRFHRRGRHLARSGDAAATAHQHVDACAALAVKHGLFGSVGSDFHSPQAAWNPLGRSLKLPDCVTPVWRSFGL